MYFSILISKRTSVLLIWVNLEASLPQLNSILWDSLFPKNWQNLYISNSILPHHSLVVDFDPTQECHYKHFYLTTLWIPVLRRQRQGDLYEFGASLFYRASFRAGSKVYIEIMFKKTKINTYNKERKIMPFTPFTKLTPNGSYTYMLIVKYRTSRRHLRN